MGVSGWCGPGPDLRPLTGDNGEDGGQNVAVNTSLSTAGCPLTWTRARPRVVTGAILYCRKEANTSLSDMQNQLNGSEGALTVLFCLSAGGEQPSVLLHWQKDVVMIRGRWMRRMDEAHAHISCPM